MGRRAGGEEGAAWAVQRDVVHARVRRADMLEQCLRERGGRKEGQQATPLTGAAMWLARLSTWL